MHCFILLKSGHYEAIVRHYALSTSFEIGSRLATKFVIVGRSAKYGGDIDESLVTQSIRDWYDGTDDEQDTDSENESDCGWSWSS